MQGLGDNLYQRAVLKKLEGRTVYLRTPWPQIYADLPNIVPTVPSTRLRTQKKNELRSRRSFRKAPAGLAELVWHYQQSATESILECLARSLGVKPDGFEMSGPDFVGPKVGRPYIVVRPVTERTEWISASRGPLPEYVAEAIEYLRKDFAIVSVADLAIGQERALKPLPYADVTYHAGELPVEMLLGLVKGAAGLVGGVGWIVPAALAYRRSMLLIYGGWGYSNGPHRLFGPGVEHGFIDEVLPDEFCRCNSNSHDCNKRIRNLGDRARTFASGLVRETSLASGSGDRVVSGRSESIQRGVLGQVPRA